LTGRPGQPASRRSIRELQIQVDDSSPNPATSGYTVVQTAVHTTVERVASPIERRSTIESDQTVTDSDHAKRSADSLDYVVFLEGPREGPGRPLVVELVGRHEIDPVRDRFLGGGR
jgi:hypothetical protein